jgi:hypothetical protein
MLVNKPLSPLERKRIHIGQIFVKHPDVVGVREFLDQLHLAGFRLREMETAYIRGWSRCGKSETIKRWIHDLTGQHVLPGVYLQLLQGNGIRIIYADMTIGATPNQASQMIGWKLFGSEKIRTLSELAVTDEFIELLKKHRVAVLVIDEAQWLLRSLGPKGADKFASWILTIENARAFQLVLLGAPFLELIQLSVDAAAARQAGSRLLNPFPFDTPDRQAKYAAFVKSFSSQTPFKKNWITEALETEKRFDTLRALYFADRGRPGNHAKLQEHATLFAGGDAQELTKEHFRAAFDLRYLADSKYKGFNPFRESDYVRLPPFPLSVAEADPDAQMKAFMRTMSGNRKGGRLYGDD